MRGDLSPPQFFRASRAALGLEEAEYHSPGRKAWVVTQTNPGGL